MKIKTKLGLGLGVQLLFTGALGVTALFGMLSVNRQFRFVVEHDAIVIANARHLSKLVVDMETGQRGFCITQQEEFLEPYTAGAKEFDGILIEGGEETRQRQFQPGRGAGADWSSRPRVEAESS